MHHLFWAVVEEIIRKSGEMWVVDLGFDSSVKKATSKLLGTAECGRRPPRHQTSRACERGPSDLLLQSAKCLLYEHLTDLLRECLSERLFHRCWKKLWPWSVLPLCKSTSDGSNMCYFHQLICWTHQHFQWNNINKCPREWSLKIQIIQSISLCDTSPPWTIQILSKLWPVL